MHDQVPVDDSTVFQAVRETSVVFSLSGQTRLRLTGADRAKFLHNFCTNEVLKLPVGRGCEAFFCNAKGRILGHGTIFAGMQEHWIETVPGQSSLLAHLDRYIIREDVAIEEVTSNFVHFALIGPQAPALIERLLSSTVRVDALAPLACLSPETPHEWIVAIERVDWLSSPSWVLVGRAATAEALWQAILAEGAVAGSRSAWESLRIEQGYPLYGIDISPDNLPQEVARNAQAISFNKGCYLGQEPVARLDALGHTNKELRRLLIEGGHLELPTNNPTQPVSLYDLTTGNAVGLLTSAARDPQGQGVVALGYLKTKWTTAGTQVRVEGSETGPIATVR